ncbi:MAG: fumarate hydratase C-terminal domain-containing protein [Clostridia bacterium]|nr:fumarate hydratase C-terminal domain-containing protein [Clostridia bacterium]
MIRIHTADLRRAAPTLRAGQRILLSGTVYTARDAAHKRLMALLDEGAPLPFPLADGVIYYCGSTPAPEGLPIGACGPTTSSRMDPYTPRLYDLGLCATIGKGERDTATCEAIVRNGGVYLCAIGGAGALVARHVRAAEVIAFPDLGCEAIKRLEIEDLPLFVAEDCHGGSIFSRR